MASPLLHLFLITLPHRNNHLHHLAPQSQTHHPSSHSLTHYHQQLQGRHYHFYYYLSVNLNQILRLEHAHMGAALTTHDLLISSSFSLFLLLVTQPFFVILQHQLVVALSFLRSVFRGSFELSTLLVMVLLLKRQVRRYLFWLTARLRGVLHLILDLFQLWKCYHCFSRMSTRLYSNVICRYLHSF